MKKHFIIAAALVLSASLAQSQTSAGGSSGGTSGAATSSGASSGSAAPSGFGTPSSGQSAAPSGFGTGAQPPPGAAVNAGASVGANRPQDATRKRVFVNTQNRPGMGGTNQPSFGVQPGSNPGQFGGTNGPVPFSNGVAPSPIPGNGTVNEAAGATATPAPATTQTAADQAFAQRLQAALGQTGATQIYFPQTRSTVQVMNQNGTVTLQGVVSSEAEKQSIESRVRGMQGISSINNQLQISANPLSPTATPATPPTPPAPPAGNGRQLLNP